MLTLRSVARREDLPYIVGEILGKGSYGEVVEVIHRSDGYHFAMKVIKTQKRTRKLLKEELLKEAKSIQTLQNHHHFIKLFDAYETSTEIGLVMWPAADGRSLAHCLEDYLDNDYSQKWLTPCFEKAFGCLASALACMHENRIRHKDIKPANILIHEGRALLSDFGSSHNSSQIANSITEGPSQTTKMYMAPEVFAEQPRDSASDVYSLGCVFLELLFALVLKKEIKICILSKEIPSLQIELLSSLPITSQWAIPAIQFLSMVTEDPSARATAATIASSLCEIPKFRCEGCSERDRWNWNPAHGKYYSITLCPGGLYSYTWQP